MSNNPFAGWTEAKIREHHQRLAESRKAYKERQSPNETNNTRHQTPDPKPEQIVRHEPLAKVKRAPENTPRFFIRIESRRLRLLDPDNLCPKYFIDAAKYAKLIPDDTAADIRFTINQVKVKKKDHECTVIEIREVIT